MLFHQMASLGAEINFYCISRFTGLFTSTVGFPNHFLEFLCLTENTLYLKALS